MAARVWLITGVSTGFGRELAIAALGRGDRVVGTVRKAEQMEPFRALAPGRAFAIQLDVTDAAAIPRAIDAAARDAGAFDILVNNAGYGLFGAVEEVSDGEARRVMETNFFGTLNVIRAALPTLRARGGGNIVNFSSVAGFMGLPGGGLYCASKFAVGGLSESLAIELAPFNIKVTSVEPGGFRTNFAGGSLAIAAKPMKEYDATPAGQTRNNIAHYSGREPGDPKKAANAILKLVDSPTPPTHLILGEDALGWARGKLQRLAADYDGWAATSVDTKLDG